MIKFNEHSSKFHESFNEEDDNDEEYWEQHPYWQQDAELFAYRYLKNEKIFEATNEICDLIIESIEDEGGFDELWRGLEEALEEEGAYEAVMDAISKVKSEKNK